MGQYEELFKFAAKAGSLEGYTFEREKYESLSNWVDNLDGMYVSLAGDVKKDIARTYRGVLSRILESGRGSLEPSIRVRLEGMAAEVEKEFGHGP